MLRDNPNGTTKILVDILNNQSIRKKKQGGGMKKIYS